MLYLTQRQVTLVDAADLPLVLQYRWFACRYRGRWRVQARTAGRGKWHLHQLLCRAGTVDHSNGDSLDNRRRNLRPATMAQQNQNRRKHCGRSQWKGVNYNARCRKWYARVKHQGRQYLGPLVETEREAAVWYNRLAQEHFGTFAYLNELSFDS